MAKHDLSKPLLLITFRCAACKYTFEAEPSRVENNPDQPFHPYSYFARCDCGQECAQAQHHQALVKAWANATGPRTAAGKAASAKNLEGHPTPEEAKRTRFNAIKHGMNAEVAQFFPARPDKYPACKACDVDRDYCERQPACVKQTQLFMLHHAAFEQRDPKHLTPIYANIQAAITSLIQQILQTIINDGVKLEAPAWAVNREGNIVIGEYYDLASGEQRTIMDVKAHPLLKPLQEFLSRNSLSLSDMGMSPKVIEQEEEALGRLKPSDDANTNTLFLEDYAAKTEKSLSSLKEMVIKANTRKEQDPVLIEYRQQMGTDKE